jgi:hypothetical protein
LNIEKFDIFKFLRQIGNHLIGPGRRQNFHALKINFQQLLAIDILGQIGRKRKIGFPAGRDISISPNFSILIFIIADNCIFILANIGFASIPSRIVVLPHSQL